LDHVSSRFHGPVTAGAPAVAEHVRPQSIAEIVAAPRTGGLVSATADPTDGRQRQLRATAAGRKLVASVLASREAWPSRAIEAVVDAARRKALMDAIVLLNALADRDPDNARKRGR
jgi:DNA-binding MarR family transcriptional regulator